MWTGGRFINNSLKSALTFNEKVHFQQNIVCFLSNKAPTFLKTDSLKSTQESVRMQETRATGDMIKSHVSFKKDLFVFYSSIINCN